MIFFEGNKNKITTLTLLVVVTTGVIGWQWLKFAPWTKIEAKPAPQFEEIGSEVKNTVEQIKTNIDDGQDQLKDIQNELAKQPEQQELLQVANEYLDQKEQNNNEDNSSVKQ